MATEQKKEELVIGENLAKRLIALGYDEVVREEGLLSFRRKRDKGNPLVPAKYDFDRWNLFKVDINNPGYRNSYGRVFGRVMQQYWLENPYYGIQFKDKTVEIVTSQLLGHLIRHEPHVAK
jgi:hypothetical protein